MTEKELAEVKEALYQYELLRIKELEEMPMVEFNPSEAYKSKKDELNIQIRKKSPKIRTLAYKRKLTGLIVAAVIIAVLVTACTFRQQIKGFFVDLFDSFASVNYTEKPYIPYKEYKLTWVPKNYKETNKVTVTNNSKVIYSNGTNLIYFTCHPVSYFYDFIDTQSTEFANVYLDNIEIYYKLKNNSYTIYWVSDNASFRLYCETDIEWSDIEKMILSVDCAE